jgi:hypothetical protein
MMKTFFTLFVCLLASISFLSAQSTPYDISNYRARFDRRPLMQLNTNINYSGRHSQDDIASNRTSLSLPLWWFLRSNTDERILNWNFSSDVRAFFGQQPGFQFPASKDRYNVFAARFTANRTVYHYRSPENFWGWGAFAAAQGDVNSSKTLDIDDNLSVQLAPRIFMGKGRIEFSEDALLANWMVQDLAEVGVISDYTPEQVEQVARAVTAIIGNRTFDFRRRRIYELRSLQQAFFDAGLVNEESFDLFAIINDNWAFANWASLPRGNRLTYGLRGEGRYSRNFQPEEFELESSRFLEGGVFAEYAMAKIINNNGSSIWNFSLAGNFLEDQFLFNNNDTERSSLYASANVNYARVWLPSSRMTFSWRNAVGADHFFKTGDEFEDVFFRSRSNINLSSRFEVDYFVSYQWTILISLGVIGDYLYDRDDPLLQFRPSVSLRSIYSIF